MKIEYEGLEGALPWFQEHAATLAISPEELREGVASLLDYLRRKRVLFDPEREIFSKYWMGGDLEIQQGYLLQLGEPDGHCCAEKAASRRRSSVTQWLSASGDTTIRQMAKKWGVEPDHVEAFLETLFKFLVEHQLLKPVRLKGSA